MSTIEHYIETGLGTLVISSVGFFYLYGLYAASADFIKGDEILWNRRGPIISASIIIWGVTIGLAVIGFIAFSVGYLVELAI